MRSLIALSALSRRSANRSPIDTMRVEGSAFSVSSAAPVPRPPQPIRPTRIVSDPPAKKLEASAGEERVDPRPRTAEVARNCRRVDVTGVALVRGACGWLILIRRVGGRTARSIPAPGARRLDVEVDQHQVADFRAGGAAIVAAADL